MACAPLSSAPGIGKSVLDGGGVQNQQSAQDRTLAINQHQGATQPGLEQDR